MLITGEEQSYRPATIAPMSTVDEIASEVSKSHVSTVKTTIPDGHCRNGHANLPNPEVKLDSPAMDVTIGPNTAPGSSEAATTSTSPTMNNASAPAHNSTANGINYDTVFNAIIKSHRPLAAQPRKRTASSEDYRKEVMAWMADDADFAWIFQADDDLITGTPPASQPANLKLRRTGHLQLGTAKSSPRAMSFPSAKLFKNDHREAQNLQFQLYNRHAC